MLPINMHNMGTTKTATLTSWWGAEPPTGTGSISWVDGGFRAGGGYGSYKIKTTKDAFCSGFTLLAATNNEAEYAALIHLLEDDRLPPGTEILTDSKLIVGQLTMGWKVKAANLMPYYLKAFKLLAISQCKLIWVPRQLIEDALGH